MTTSSTTTTGASGPPTQALLASLAKVVRPPTGRGKPPTVDLPLPDLLVRGMILVSVLLIGLWCLLLWWFSRDAVALADGIRQRQEHQRVMDHPPLPPGTDLVNPAAFEEARHRHPGRGSELHVLRALVRADNGDPRGACEDFAAAKAEALLPLDAEARLRWAECLVAEHRPAEALPLLWDMRLSTLREDLRARVIRLLVALQVDQPMTPSQRGLH